MQFIVGQRWLSSADSSLGLGVVVDIDVRSITLSFPAIGEDRIYSKNDAPLHRLELRPGDQAETAEGKEFTVVTSKISSGIYTYEGLDNISNKIIVREIDLNPHINLVTPLQRLVTGNFDRNSLFILRMLTLELLAKQQGRATRGLMGGRTNLLPHQVYIAKEIGTRHAPRALLADEVGLGKTIEAGMIIHQQILTGQSQRVLLIVPESLVHQWLVEMLRRFNLKFSIFNEERLDQEETDNAFEAEQLILCSNTLFGESEDACRLTLETIWDIVVIDEAHHEMWRSSENAAEKSFAEKLADQAVGLLLLTATPEQNSKTGYFERLKLLDPNRFQDLKRFEKEQINFMKLGELIEEVEAGNRPKNLPSDIDPSQEDETIVAQLIDRHGTGRILMRNSRTKISGFPNRKLVRHSLDASTDFTKNTTNSNLQEALYPHLKTNNESWLRTDPRIKWLEDTLRLLSPDKVVIICSKARTAIELEKHLHLRAGIRTAAFHENLSLIERDRAVAYFADTSVGAQCLICSEIGSEGRNFQFSHNLILFDLPLNPDLLEQRIGRLDRIGQDQDIKIHVPYVIGSAQHALLDWYEKGLSIFSGICPFGKEIFDKFREQLEIMLVGNFGDLQKICIQTKNYAEELTEKAQAGKDKLLERSSCRKGIAEQVIAELHSEQNPEQLATYLHQLCAAYGVDCEYHSEGCWTLKPTESMHTGYFPCLPEDGITVTVDRDIALSREDLLFLTWEHPMITESMDMVLTTEIGNATIGSLKLKSIESGTVLLETIFSPSCASPKNLLVEQFFPKSPMRILIDQRGKDIAHAISHSKLNEAISRIRRDAGAKIIRRIKSDVEEKLKIASAKAGLLLTDARESARENMTATLGKEVDRLEALKSINPSVRQEEIVQLRQRISATQTYIEKSNLELQGIRVIITT